MKSFTLKLCLIATAASLLTGGLSCWKSEDLAPPVAKIEPKVDTLFNTVMVDNYFWLRGKEKLEVIEYLNEENTYTEAVMKHTKSLQEKLYRELRSRIKETDLSVPVEHGGYYYYDREEEGKQYKIKCRKKASLDAEEEILLDINELAEGRDFMAVETFEVSSDHNLLAYATDTAGNERYTLRVIDLTTGQLYPDVIENIMGDLAWANDNKTFYYSVPDDAWRAYKLYRHTLGTKASEDKLVYHEKDDAFGIGISKTKNDRYVLLQIESMTTSEYRYLDANDPRGTFKILEPRQHELEYSLYHHGNRFLILTNDGAKNFKLVQAPISSPSKENWKELISHRENVKLDGLDVFKDFVVVYQRENGLKTIRICDPMIEETRYVEFPEPVYSYKSGSNPEFNSDMLRFTYQSLVTPKSVYDYNMKTQQRELKKQDEVPGGYDPEDYECMRVYATASDGTRIPISMVYRKGMVRDGSNPLYLYGYGSYGHSSDPWFSSNRPSLLDRGFIFAIAHVRGGGEMGRQWYDDGKLLNKKNSFTDFIACSEYLIQEKYTSSRKLVISGGSAGGLLIGAVVNMRPELSEVAIGDVPFVDVMNSMLDASIPLTVIEYEEWGNPNIEKYFHYMMSYSPYDNVELRPYPNLLITGGLNDTRVQYWEPAKWTAKLRTVWTGDERLLLKMKMGSGHHGASGRFDYLKEIAFEYAFILDCLGMT